MWDGRAKPAKVTATSFWPDTVASPRVAGTGGFHFDHVTAAVMARVRNSCLHSAIASAVNTIVSAEAAALAEPAKSLDTSAIGARVQARAQSDFQRDGGRMLDAWAREFADLVQLIENAAEAKTSEADGLTVTVPLIGQVADPAVLIDRIVAAVLNWSSEDGKFKPGGLLARRIQHNLLNASNMSEDEARK